MSRHLSQSLSKELVITNPLVLYRALLASKRIEPDPSQYALALHLQKLYHRLKDYTPEEDYASRLRQINHVLSYETRTQEVSHPIANLGHGLRRNPLFAHLFKKDTADAKAKALTKVLSSHEAAMDISSPRGLLLHGEVGVGKSMLVDLLAHCLPNAKKRRWHFNSFMLEALARLETHRKTIPNLTSFPAPPMVEQNYSRGQEYSLLWLAKELIHSSPILFFDEFQLPDRAASKILSGLLTIFFQLGGVLVASSNRLPEELGRASGIALAPRKSSWLGLGIRARSHEIGSRGDEYKDFVDVLKARCEIWEIREGKDWRRREAEEATDQESLLSEANFDNAHTQAFTRGSISSRVSKFEQFKLDHPTKPDNVNNVNSTSEKGLIPRKYLVFSPQSHARDDSAEAAWTRLVQSVFRSDTALPIAWSSTVVTVYGRALHLPRTYDGVLSATFSSLCTATYGPGDYISLASTFHTLILDQVPVLTLARKNEARRFITLLDALYEARCKLAMRAESGPDGLFFPDLEAGKAARFNVNISKMQGRETSAGGTGEAKGDAAKVDGDAVYPETLSEIYQDQTAPFRPNISSYHLASTSQTLQRPSHSSEQASDDEIDSDDRGEVVDFNMGSAYTGEDERFAYKRASSRIWEMCSARWHARGQEDGEMDMAWWVPLAKSSRTWETGDGDGRVSGSGGERKNDLEQKSIDKSEMESDVQLGKSVDLDKHAGLQGQREKQREWMRSSEES